MLQVSEIEVAENKNVKVTFANATLSTKVHVFASHFLPTNQRDMIQRLKKLIGFKSEAKSHFFDEWTNSYLSTRELTKELRYVFDRRQA